MFGVVAPCARPLRSGNRRSNRFLIDAYERAWTAAARRSRARPPRLVLFDEQQHTAVVIQQFETAEDMRAAEMYFDTMDAGETPGMRASVDRCEARR